MSRRRRLLTDTCAVDDLPERIALGFRHTFGLCVACDRVTPTLSLWFLASAKRL